MTNDLYRQIRYKAQVFASTGAKTVKQAIDMTLQEFLSKVFNYIEYKKVQGIIQQIIAIWQ